MFEKNVPLLPPSEGKNEGNFESFRTASGGVEILLKIPLYTAGTLLPDEKTPDFPEGLLH